MCTSICVLDTTVDWHYPTGFAPKAVLVDPTG
jgi:hypothetical protein